MYGIALTVAACLRSGTRADVAWVVEADGLPVGDWSDAVVFTPGGGRIGSLAGGALDGQLADLAGRWNAGRLVGIEVGQVDALIAGLDAGGSATCLLAPAATLPGDLWDLALERLPLCLVARLDADEVVETRLYTAGNIAEADDEVARLFTGGASGSTRIGDLVVSVFRAVPQLVVIGSGPIPEKLAEVASSLGWQTRIVTDADTAAGVIATLSMLDKVVVAGHDLELTGSALMAALEHQVGYIGALGSRRMRQDRADWLAYRGVTDLDRIHGPAGLDIGADTPGEIAVAVLAEAIADRHSPAPPAS